ncbi:uncharacterized protein LOC136027750 [Artemia franciscana]|uniref:uncharacterized protein LOC136027750 n=1 Tax=Artemia franciscana TaxID=6661 RepID=UPI0032DB78FF
MVSIKVAQLIQTIESNDFVTRLLDDGLLVDVIFFDQAKLFDKVQHQLLLLKMEACRVYEDIVAWIEAFLTGRTQRVVIHDATGKTLYDDEIPVISGALQGTILGFTLFGIYTIDCTTHPKNPWALYTGNCKLLGLVQISPNHSTMQEDLDQLSRWSSEWSLQFNMSKCKVLHLGYDNSR